MLVKKRGGPEQPKKPNYCSTGSSIFDCDQLKLYTCLNYFSIKFLQKDLK